MIFLPPFLYKLWAGQYELPRAFWGFGLIGWWAWIFFITAVVGIPLKLLGLNRPRIAIGVLLVLAYTVLAMVGIWRSASAYARTHRGSYWGGGAKVAICLFAAMFVQNYIFKGGAERMFGALMGPP